MATPALVELAHKTRPTLPTYLYHGTQSNNLPSILKHGIKPRGGTGRNNWKRTVGSNKQAVYLSICYGFYFAHVSAQEDEDSAIIELRTSNLLALHADEDALEQYNRGKDHLPADWDMKRRTIWYRARAHQYAALASLQYMGTCGHRGTIPPEAIRRVCVIPRARVLELILSAYDPMITAMNFRIMEQQHTQFHAWLFGDVPELEGHFTPSREGIVVTEYNM